MLKPIEILRACYPARREIIPCLIGEPGIGKTQCVYQLGEELGVNVHMMNMNGKAPNEIVGMAMPNQENGTMEMFDYGILCKAEDGDIVIIDEMLTSAPACLNAILTLAESRILPSGKKIADVMLVAAANPLPSPDRISLAVRDRFQFIQVGFDTFSWKDYIKRTLDIDVISAISSKIRISGKDYNVPTPRTITKYLWWLSKICTTKKEREVVYDIIETVFDSGMANAFRKQFENIPKDEQVRNAVHDMGVRITTERISYKDKEVVTDKPFNEMDPVEMLETLSKLPDWEELEKLLSEVEIEQDNKLFY